MTAPATRLSRFWLLLAVLLSGFLALPDFGDDVAGRTGGGVALLHRGLQWLLVEPLGLAGAIGAVMGCGAAAAWLSWPRERGER